MTSEERIKCVLIGSSGTGKTSIMTRYISDKFIEDTNSTIGASFFSQTLLKNDRKIKLEIWDTAGQERFDSLMPLYYRGSDIILVVYDITSYVTFKKATEWIRNISIDDDTINPIFVLIGNKYDLEEKRAVKYEEAFKYAEERNILFLETSAKTSRNVKDIFGNSLDLVSFNKKKKDISNKKIIDKKIINDESSNNNSYFSSCFGMISLIGIGNK
jgi:small GTP-binding protein